MAPPKSPAASRKKAAALPKKISGSVTKKKKEGADRKAIRWSQGDEEHLILGMDNVIRQQASSVPSRNHDIPVPTRQSHIESIPVENHRETGRLRPHGVRHNYAEGIVLHESENKEDDETSDEETSAMEIDDKDGVDIAMAKNEADSDIPSRIVILRIRPELLRQFPVDGYPFITQLDSYPLPLTPCSEIDHFPEGIVDPDHVGNPHAMVTLAPSNIPCLAPMDTDTAAGSSSFMDESENQQHLHEGHQLSYFDREGVYIPGLTQVSSTMDPDFNYRNSSSTADSSHIPEYVVPCAYMEVFNDAPQGLETFANRMEFSGPSLDDYGRVMNVMPALDASSNSMEVSPLSLDEYGNIMDTMPAPDASENNMEVSESFLGEHGQVMNVMPALDASSNDMEVSGPFLHEYGRIENIMPGLDAFANSMEGSSTSFYTAPYVETEGTSPFVSDPTEYAHHLTAFPNGTWDSNDVFNPWGGDSNAMIPSSYSTRGLSYHPPTMDEREDPDPSVMVRDFASQGPSGFSRRYYSNDSFQAPEPATDFNTTYSAGVTTSGFEPLNFEQNNLGAPSAMPMSYEDPGLQGYTSNTGDNFPLQDYVVTDDNHGMSFGMMDDLTTNFTGFELGEQNPESSYYGYEHESHR